MKNLNRELVEDVIILELNDTNTYNINNLHGFTNYSLKLCVENEVGCSNFTKSLQFTTNISGKN